MAAASDNQGLKIAVAAFVTLTVILAVTTYFGYSSYSQAEEKRIEAEKTAQAKNQATAEALRNYDDLKTKAGYAKVEDPTAVKDAITKDEKARDAQLEQIRAQIGTMLEQYRAGGGNQQTVEQLAAQTDQIINTYRTEPNQTFQSALSRMLEIMTNLTGLSTALQIDNATLQMQLRTVNTANKAQLDQAMAATDATRTDLEGQQTAHADQMATLRTEFDRLSTENDNLAKENTSLRQQLDQFKAEAGERENRFLATVNTLRDAADADPTKIVLDRPDGHVTFVDAGRQEIRTDITRRVGAREQMQMVIFDRNAPGVPTSKPKATIELIRVTDQGSIARIIETKVSSDPIRVGDIVYSAAWSPNNPERFALIGKIDVDRDGRDDRDDLKRMITAAGGIIDFDLPPPGANRPKTGAISPLTSFYVVDTREPIRPQGNRNQATGEDDAKFVQDQTEAISTARRNGVRPMSIERILAYLGYSYGASIPGRVEGIDRQARDRLLRPGGNRGILPPAEGEGNEPSGDDLEPGNP